MEMGSSQQENFHNEKRFQKRIDIKQNIIRKFLCQMINCEMFQLLISYIVVLLGGMFDCRYLAKSATQG